MRSPKPSPPSVASPPPAPPTPPPPAQPLTEVEAAVPTDELQGVHQLPAAQGLAGAVSSIAARGEGQEGEQRQHRLPHWKRHGSAGRGEGPEPPASLKARGHRTAEPAALTETETARLGGAFDWQQVLVSGLFPLGRVVPLSRLRGPARPRAAGASAGRGTWPPSSDVMRAGPPPGLPAPAKMADGRTPRLAARASQRTKSRAPAGPLQGCR